MQNVEQVACVYKRIKKGRGRRKRIDFERVPAIKQPGSNGSVLLRPLPPAPANNQHFITVILTEGVTAQLAARTDAPQELKAPRNDGSAQCSPLIIGTGKQACVGSKFTF